ncbi:MAG: replication initiation protein [Peptoniphilus rhinitidis]|uniref:replication initiation protein n=1 Tax=Peptoniphilus rhinitidis TaxID=1175452 RepID=UPI0028FF72A8|nr:replication initiation protein [Peptoniphilus rhinitidis]MDU2108975.1 replication initiation protein [Peptoniphilus lacydonensis]MDU3750174.1 replication initiation protein [Peptoniphilus rhinitidis]
MKKNKEKDFNKYEFFEVDPFTDDYTDEFEDRIIDIGTDIETDQLTLWDETSLVRKGNPLIRSRMSWSLNAQKILLLVASSFDELTDIEGDRFVNERDKNFWSISVSELENQLGVKKLNSAYLKELATVMAKSTIEMNLPNERTGELNWELAPLFSYARYENGILTLELTRLCKEQLGRLKTGYTQYALKDVIRMKSQYSIRIYELISSEKFKAPIGKVTYTVVELRKLLGILDPKKYRDFNSLERRAIKPAVNEVNEKNIDTIYITYKKLYKGRSINRIEFTYIDKKQIKDNADNVIKKPKYVYDYTYDEDVLFSTVKPLKEHRRFDWKYYSDLAISILDSKREVYEALKSLDFTDQFIILEYLKHNYNYVKNREAINFESYYIYALMNDYANALTKIEG